MPTTQPPAPFHARVAWPRHEGAFLPALAGGAAPAMSNARSRFTFSPLSISLDGLLLIVTAALLGIGVVMVHSSEARVGPLATHWFLRSLLTRSAVHAALALGALVFLWRLDYRKLAGTSLLRSPAMVLLAASVGMLALVLTRFGADINGSRRWLLLPLGVAHVSFQPSELAKWSLVLFIGAYAVHNRERIRSLLKGFIPLIAAVGVTAALIVREDFGTAALICGVCLVLLLMAGCKWWHIALLIPPALVVAYFAVWHSAYRRERLLIFLHPQADPTGAGYHPIQSLLSFASGGFWGRGLGNGIQKMGFLPEDNTDFIFSVIAEELGFFGAMLVIMLFLSLLLAGWRIALRATEPFGKIMACGITAMVALQAAMNIAVVTVTVPTKGIALPLISSGGTGWIMTAAAIGVLMSIERCTRLQLSGVAAAPQGDKTEAAGAPPAEPLAGLPPAAAPTEALPNVMEQT